MLLTSFPSSYLQELREVQGRWLCRKVAGISTPALCPDIPSHTARCCCSPPAALSRPKELTAVLCMHIYLSFKQRDTEKHSLTAWGQTSLTQMPSQSCYTCLTCWVRTACSPLWPDSCSASWHTLISAITVFGSDSSKPEINCGPKDITPNPVSSKHHHFQSSSERAVHLLLLEALPSEPGLSSKILCAGNRHLFNSSLSSAHHFSYQQPHSLSFVLWERTTVASKLVHSPKEEPFK